MDILASIIKVLFGSKADKDRKQIEPYLEKIKAVYPSIEKLSNDELRARSEALKKHAHQGFQKHRTNFRMPSQIPCAPYQEISPPNAWQAAFAENWQT